MTESLDALRARAEAAEFLCGLLALCVPGYLSYFTAVRNAEYEAARKAYRELHPLVPRDVLEPPAA